MGKDKIEILNKRLKDVASKFNALKQSGLDEEILILYLSHKTKLSRKKVKQLLDNQEEFYNKLVKEVMLDNL